MMKLLLFSFLMKFSPSKGLRSPIILRRNYRHSPAKHVSLSVVKRVNSERGNNEWKENSDRIMSEDILESFSRHNRRYFLKKSILIGTSTSSASLSNFQSSALASPLEQLPSEGNDSSFSWPLGKVAFSLLPLAGTYSKRITVEEEVIPDTIWTYDQIQGVVNVNVPVRQVVIKLSPQSGGGLLVHNPVAPTPQLLSMMKNLEAKHGKIRHIILGTVALEHKATFGAFAQNFPYATVWIQPGQWAFPSNLPLEFLGVSQRGLRFRELPVHGKPCTNSLFQHFADIAASDKNTIDPEWTNDISYEVLGPLNFKSVGSFSETAFFHKATKTLIVTDAVVSITEDAPPIIQADPRAMLFHARDSISQKVTDDFETRRKGWRRMVQFGFFFFPSQIDVVPFAEALNEAKMLKDPFAKSLGQDAVPFNLYPWTWRDSADDVKNFQALAQNGKLVVPPILTKLILDREPVEVKRWVTSLTTKFKFTHIISSHMNNYVKSSPEEFYDAFRVLDDTRYAADNVLIRRPLAQDLALLQKASDILTKLNVVEASRVCDGEPARILGRFASGSIDKTL